MFLRAVFILLCRALLATAQTPCEDVAPVFCLNPDCSDERTRILCPASCESCDSLEQAPCVDLSHRCPKVRNACDLSLNRRLCPATCGECDPEVNNDPMFRRCCELNGISPGCLDLCTFDFDPSAITSALRAGCEPRDGQVALTCASMGFDRRRCCQIRDVDKCEKTCSAVYDFKEAVRCFSRYNGRLVQCFQGDETGPDRKDESFFDKLGTAAAKLLGG